MAQYRTEQKTMLLDFLRSHGENAYTVDELVEGMRLLYGEGTPATSTVYRLMTYLVEEGTVKRFVKGHSRRFVYQIVGGRDCHAHLHLKCMECGKLLHLDETVSERLLCAVRSSNDFSVSEEETVLFGACAVCRGNKEKTEGRKK